MLMFDNNIEIYSDLRLVPSGNNISILKTQFSFNEAQSDWHMLVNRFRVDLDWFYRPSFFLGVTALCCIIHRVYYQISIAKLDLGRATATVSLHVDLHNTHTSVSTTIHPLRLSF